MSTVVLDVKFFFRFLTAFLKACACNFCCRESSEDFAGGEFFGTIFVTGCKSIFGGFGFSTGTKSGLAGAGVKIFSIRCTSVGAGVTTGFGAGGAGCGCGVKVGAGAGGWAFLTPLLNAASIKLAGM